jgi:hypothetical protein
MSNYKGIKNVSTIFFFFRATTQCFYTKYGIQKVPINNFAFIFALLPKDNIFWKQRGSVETMLLSDMPNIAL